MTDVKEDFPSLNNVFCGQLAPYVPTEVGCEALFSSSGHANDPRRVNLLIRLYERLVIGKHRMYRIYVSTKNVERRFIHKFKNNSWNEDEDRDNNEYLEQELEIWKANHPATAEKMLRDEEEDGSIDEESVCVSTSGGGEQGAIEDNSIVSGESLDDVSNSMEEASHSSHSSKEGDGWLSPCEV